MLQVYLLLVASTMFAYMARESGAKARNTAVTTAIKTRGAELHLGVPLFVLIALLVWFAGLRTTMNDTRTYLLSYGTRVPNTLSGLSGVNWDIGANPLFNCYEILLRALVSESGQVFLFITSGITVTSMLCFLYKYSIDFGLSVYVFLAFTVYAFTMAAMKQCMATAIGIWAVPEFYLHRRVRASAIILIAMLFHPYVVVLASALLFEGHGMWNRRAYIAVILTIIAALSFDAIVGRAIGIVSTIGDDYSFEWFASGTGVGFKRILFYMLVPILAYIGRGDRLNEDQLQTLFVNLCIVAGCLSALSGLGGSVLLGRVPNYFDLFICISLPYVSRRAALQLNMDVGTLQTVLMAAYLFFYQAYYAKYFALYTNPLLCDVYARTTFFEMLSGW